MTAQSAGITSSNPWASGSLISSPFAREQTKLFLAAKLETNKAKSAGDPVL
jgi:hypothetical protein